MVPAISSVAGATGALGETPNLACYHRKAASMLAGARGFNGRIQCQQAGVLADVLGDGNHLADLLAGSIYPTSSISQET